MAIDLILYAVIAGGLVVWLRTLLGTRHGEERQRPGAMPTLNDGANSDSMVSAKPKKSGDTNVVNPIIHLNDNPDDVFSIADNAARDGLLAIEAVDKSFAIKPFLTAAQDAFVMGVESFAEGDLKTLEDLLGKNVFKAFKHAVKEREKAGQTQTTQIHAITKTQVLEAGVKKNDAFVTLRFEADQTSYLTDKNGKGVAGHPDETHAMVDIWTFSRSTRSTDPRWFVSETRGDFEDDNAIIPDAS